MSKEVGQCVMCKNEYTSKNVLVRPGKKVHVCTTCMRKAKANFLSFIWMVLTVRMMS
ncbi:MAG: hypothetical protein HZC49_08050 [Nitrospirae bacterium]|nr:hypothetical protein [Nitrospirota bacterium]